VVEEENKIEEVVDLTADWKTYTSDELGIKFLYPPSFRDAYFKNAVITLTDNSIEEEKRLIERFNKNNDFHEVYNYGNILRVDFAKTKDIEKYTEDNENEFLSSKDIIIINDKPWFYYQYDSGYAGKASIELSTYLDDIKKIIFFEYDTYNPENLVSLKVILVKMIESMEFI